MVGLFSSRLPLVALVAAVGFQLRAVVLAVPPVLPAIRDDLHLTFTAAGALTALPVLCLGAAAVPGAFLVNRFGARLVVGAGTAGLGVTALLRLAPPEPVALFAFSGLMALSVAVAHPAMTVIVRAWFPGAVQRAGTVFASALGLGGLGGAVLTVHLASAVGWRGSFVVWSLLALAVGLAWLAVAPAPTPRNPHPTTPPQEIRTPPPRFPGDPGISRPRFCGPRSPIDMGSLRSSAHDHDLAHLDDESLASLSVRTASPRWG